MDLIANSIAWVLAFFASVLGNILAHDICASADRTCTKIIRNAARRLAHFDREPVELEWLADLHDRVTVREKYQHAIGCFLVAGKMRRQATSVTVAMNLQIDGVGSIPLSLNLTSKLTRAFFAAGGSRFHWVRRTNAIIGILYILMKLIRAANTLGPAKLSKLGQEKLKEYKTWGYQARLKRKGLDLDMGNVFRAMVLNPKQIPDILRRVVEALSVEPNHNSQSTPSA
jgi:hypothetical protein